jgi:hypothetical protein
LVWLRLAVEGRPEFDPAVMAFKNEVFKIEQISLSVRDKKARNQPKIKRLTRIRSISPLSIFSTVTFSTAVAVAIRFGCPANPPSPKKSPGPIIPATGSLPRLFVITNECDQNGTDSCYGPIYDAVTDGEMRMIGTKIEGWVGSSPILAAPRSQTSPGEARGIIA